METSIMKARLISTSNQHIVKYVGETRECQIKENRLFMVRVPDKHYIQTSKIKDYSQTGKFIRVETQNSVYELEIIVEEEK